MTFQVFPEDHHIDNDSESEVLGWLYDQVTDDRVQVFCNQEWLDGGERREMDFIVSIPDVGVCIVEVKGGTVDIIGNQWRQWSKSEKAMVPRNFVYQLDCERRTVRDILLQSFDPYNMPKIGYVLVTPKSSFDLDAILPGMSRTVLVSKSDQDELWSTIVRQTKNAKGSRDFTAIDQLAVRTLLEHPGETYESIVATTRQRGETVEYLTVEQSFILEMMEENERIQINGGPGTGKTVVAIEEALRLVRIGKRVGLLCYNRGLASFFKHQMKKVDPHSQPEVVGTVLEGLRVFAGLEEFPLPEDPAERAAYYDVDVPRQILAALEAMPIDGKLDAIVLDEVQDMSEMYWKVIQAAMKDPINGKVVLVGDPTQELRENASPAPWPHLAKARLGNNLRNSRSIAKALNAFYEGKQSQPRGVINGVPPEVHVVEKSDLVISEVENFIGQLVDEFHWQRGDITVLTTHHLHEKHIAAKAQGDDDYWEEHFKNNDVFYSHINAYKGLERPYVILAINGFSSKQDRDAQTKSLYVGASRARDELAIFGTEQDLEALGAAVSRMTVERV